MSVFIVGLRIKPNKMNSDKEYKLIIERRSVLSGIALKTNILVNGEIKNKLSIGKSLELILPREFSRIKLFNKVPLGKEIVKEFVVDPVTNSEVRVVFYYKVNWMAMIPPLMYMMPTSSIITEIEYIP